MLFLLKNASFGPAYTGFCASHSVVIAEKLIQNPYYFNLGNCRLQIYPQTLIIRLLNCFVHQYHKILLKSTKSKLKNQKIKNKQINK